MSDAAELIRLAPQASVIKEADQKRWLEGIMRYHRSRAAWHAKRLYGIGGSEMGAVLRHMLGVRDSGFSNISRVVEQKLLKRLPDYQTIHMRRGTALEDLARLAFLFKYQAKPDTAAMAAMVTPHSKAGYEWLAGNPDDFVEIRGKRYLVDYKIPSTYDDQIDYDYKAQLHHYELGGRFRGIKCDGGLLLVKLDLAPELALSLTEKITRQGGIDRESLIDMARMIAKANIPSMRIMGHIVESDREMSVDILDCGAECWSQYVLRGVVPEMGKGEKLQILEDAQNLRVAQYQQQYAMAKAGISQLEQIAKAAGQALQEELSSVELAKVSLPVNMVIAKEKVTLNHSEVIAEAIERGATEEELQSEPGSYSIPALLAEIKRLGGNVDDVSLREQAGADAEKAKAFLAARDIPIGPFETREVTIALSRKKEDTQSQQALQSMASERFRAWLAEMTGQMAGTQPDDALNAAYPLSELFGSDTFEDYLEEEPEVSRPIRQLSMK